MRKIKEGKVTQLYIRKSKLTELLGFEPFGIKAGKSYPLSTILNLLTPSHERNREVLLYFDKRDHTARITVPVHSLPYWSFYFRQAVDRHGEVEGIGYYFALRRKRYHAG